ncbi:NAD kinase [Bacillaceae bacterium SIJ1]|uniref:NAD kinase n=1 Tax=Litoribacterium kuwaitense TaxID=1398745 RepID=UPI0013EAA7D5|nr:NAD kinase [Litoribacterium kuwaitense]NGP44177.1 NAD kinase [Litoribacterium kuwaitense]
MNQQSFYFFYKNIEDRAKRFEQLQKAADTYNFQLEKDFNKADVIVSIGDDGTFLQAVRKTGFRQNCIYVGLSYNSEPRLYCDFSLQDTETIKQALNMTDTVEVRRYPTIEVSINEMNPFLCLNECSIRSSIIKTFVMDVYIDDLHFETFRGDGMVVSTPTGSTAYSKSINGAIIDPKLQCLQISELASLNNNRYRTLGSPFVLNDDRKLRLVVRQDGNDYPIIGLDNEAFSTQNIRTIDIQISDRKISTAKLRNNSFWEKVQRTFL